MDAQRIQELYEYNRWANSRMLDVAAKLTLDEFTRDLQSSYRSVRDTLVHIMSAEWIWLMRCKGTSPKAMLDSSGFATLPQLRARWAGIESGQTEFVAAITEESLDTMVRYINMQGEPFQYPLWQILQHVVNHSTYHRGQITTMARQLGAEPVATDFLIFYDERSSRAR